MSISNYFYHETSKKYIAVFGSLFNKITIERKDRAGNVTERMPVPISYGPWQKYLARVEQDPNLDRKVAMTLPRMAFEMPSLEYDPTRRVASTKRFLIENPDSTDANSKDFMYAPAPYNFNFTLYIMAKHAEDAIQIVEQITPFFKPEYTFSLQLIEGSPSFDVPLVLNSVNMDDLYESDFLARRSIIWTLNFTMKGYFFGPVREKSVIKFIDARFFTDTRADVVAEEQVTLQPGLTLTGTPTNSANNSIDYTEIFEDDDWGLITMIQEFNE